MPNEKLATQKLVNDMGDAVISVALSDDATLCAAGTTSARAVVFNVEENKELLSLQLQSGVNAVQFLGSGECSTLAIGTFAGFVNTYFTNVKLQGGQQPPKDERKFTGVPFGKPVRGVLCLASACGGKRLVGGGKGSLVVVFNVELKWAEAAKLQAMWQVDVKGEIVAVSLNDDATLLATGSDARVVQLWQLRSDKTQAFADIDSDNSGTLSVEELRHAIGKMTGALPPRTKVAALVTQFDSTGSGEVSLEDFKKLCAFLEDDTETPKPPTKGLMGLPDIGRRGSRWRRQEGRHSGN